MSSEARNLSAGAMNAPPAVVPGPAYTILFAIGVCHLLLDIMAGLLPGVYPMLKGIYGLSFAQVGLIALISQVTSSMIQPVFGYLGDRRPRAYYLMAGMACSLIGILGLAFSRSYHGLLLSAAVVGFGGAVFHPESSRVARTASGGQPGMAQSIFQVGGNFGFALGPLIAAFFVLKRGQTSMAWLSIFLLIAMALLYYIGRWYRSHVKSRAKAHAHTLIARHNYSRGRVGWIMAILLVLIFSKYIYLASLTTYFIFYLISKFHVSMQSAQIHLFFFLGSTVTGILVGGPLGDRIGRRYIIWFSILGVLPFTLLMPYVNLMWTSILSVIIAMVLSSAFSAILVYAQELIPGRVGMIAGLFFGFAFGVAGAGAAVRGAGVGLAVAAGGLRSAVSGFRFPVSGFAGAERLSASPGLPSRKL